MSKEPKESIQRDIQKLLVSTGFLDEEHGKAEVHTWGPHTDIAWRKAIAAAYPNAAFLKHKQRQPNRLLDVDVEAIEQAAIAREARLTPVETEVPKEPEAKAESEKEPKVEPKAEGTTEQQSQDTQQSSGEQTETNKAPPETAAKEPTEDEIKELADAHTAAKLREIAITEEVELTSEDNKKSEIAYKILLKRLK